MPEPITATPTTPAAPPPAATQTAPAAQPTAGVSPTPAAAPAAAAAPWYGDITDPDLKGWAELKKFSDPTAALKAGREAEKLIGVPAGEILRIPKADAPKAEWDAYYNKGGRPATANDYKLEVPMGDDGGFAKSIAPILYEAGISATQAKFLNEKWNALMAGTLEQSKQQADQQSLANTLSLQREWGSSYDKRVELGRRALRAFGAELGGTPEEQHTELLKLENHMGSNTKLIKLFAAIGEKLGEANFHEGDGAARGFEGMTPGAAKARKEELMSNPDWQARYKSGDKAALAELDQLQRIQNSGAKAGA